MNYSISRLYQHRFDLKYGCNPQQKSAGIYQLEGCDFPFEILNGKPGYINLLDALNSWQLVKEADQALGLPAAASFKHVSPAGVAVSTPISDLLKDVYECQNTSLSPLATAYIRARGADPKSSFGDFIALSRSVDVDTAKIIKGAVSDGIIAPDYEPAALAILKGKKKGNYVILKVQSDFNPPREECREIYGVGFIQDRNDLVLSNEQLFSNIVTENNDLSENAKRDLLLASITIKYTQSNSVGYAIDGQMIGIGAGQQSRIDCTRLAGSKADIWFLRQHEKVRNLPFKPEIKKQERINARIRYIEDDMTPKEREIWLDHFTNEPLTLTLSEKEEWLENLENVSLSSDAFFPFRDNIDQASRHGVKNIVQPGGSVRDADVIKACNEYSMIMSYSKTRLFHH